MKKIISIILCLTLVLGLAVVASADGETAGLVTDASKLSDGQQIVIASIDNSTAMGALSGTICTSVNATISDDKSTLTLTDDICVVTLEAHPTDANTWALKVDGGYLVCTANKKLAIQENAGYWTISIAAVGTAIIESVDVSGSSMQYNVGSPRFTAYNSAQAAVSIYAVGVEGSVPAGAPTDPVEIVNAAYALADGEKLPYSATLTGTITEAAAANYGSITVTISIEGCDGKPIVCYGMRGDGVDVIGVGDTITVSGTLTNYKGTIEFASGCTLQSYTKAETPSDPTPSEPTPSDPTPSDPTPSDPTPSEPEVTIPEAGSTLTIPEAKEVATMGTDNKYYITGTVTEITNTTYGNLYITDKDGNTILIYGIYSADGSTRFDAMENQPKVGDTITLYTVLTTYNGTPEAKNAWLVENGPATTADSSLLSVAIALMAVSAMGIAVVGSKKKEF